MITATPAPALFGPGHRFDGTITVGALDTTATITHNLGIAAPFTAIIGLWLAGVPINIALLTGMTFTTNSITCTFVAAALGTGTLQVLVLA